jgi:hypothetical protein
MVRKRLVRLNIFSDFIIPVLKGKTIEQATDVPAIQICARQSSCEGGVGAAA